MMLILVFLFNKTQTFSPEANKNGNENRAPEKKHRPIANGTLILFHISEETY